MVPSRSVGSDVEDGHQSPSGGAALSIRHAPPMLSPTGRLSYTEVIHLMNHQGRFYVLVAVTRKLLAERMTHIRANYRQVTRIRNALHCSMITNRAQFTGNPPYSIRSYSTPRRPSYPVA